MDNLLPATVGCPYCGESIEVDIDCSVAHQEYIEDCSVCCRPIIIAVETSPGSVDRLDVRTEDD